MVAARVILVGFAVAIFHFMLQLITILNRCHRFPGFVYQQARFSSDHKSIEIAVRPRKGSKAICSRCHQPAPGYDQLAERRFEFIPFWGFLVFLLYSMRRVDCRRCQAVVVEEVPWADGKRTLTKAYMLFLARWARRLSWKETAEAFRTSWDKVFDAVEHVVTWGLEHRVLGQIDAIGVDEIQYAKGHKYLTLVYQIDLGVTRLLWVGKERTIESFQGFFTAMGKDVISKIVFVSNSPSITHLASCPNPIPPTISSGEPAFAFRGWPKPPTKLWQASGSVSKVQSFSAMADFWSFGPPLATVRA